MFHNDKLDVAETPDETEEMATLTQLFAEAAEHASFLSSQELQALVLPQVATSPMNELLEQEEVMEQGVLPVPAAAEPAPSTVKPKRKRENASSQNKKPRKPKSITGKQFFLDTNERELVPEELEQFSNADNRLCVTHNGKTRMIGSDATWVKTRRRYGEGLKRYVPIDAVLEHREDGDYYQGQKVTVLNDVYNAKRAAHRNRAYQAYSERNSSVLFQSAENKPGWEPSVLSDYKLGI